MLDCVRIDWTERPAEVIAKSCRKCVYLLFDGSRCTCWPIAIIVAITILSADTQELKRDVNNGHPAGVDVIDVEHKCWNRNTRTIQNDVIISRSLLMRSMRGSVNSTWNRCGDSIEKERSWKPSREKRANFTTEEIFMTSNVETEANANLSSQCMIRKKCVSNHISLAAWKKVLSSRRSQWQRQWNNFGFDLDLAIGNPKTN